MIRSKMVMAILLGVVLALFGATAAGAGDPYAPTTTESTTTAPPSDDVPSVTVVRGESLDVSGDSCLPGDTVTVTWDDGTVLGTFTADADGNWSGVIEIPENATLGTHTTAATCGDVVKYLDVTVVGESAAPVDSGTLARTGSSTTGPLLGVAAAAIILGGAFLYGARRPRQA